ncbi:GNAT family N-acetyltransferase [Rubneribacter badeniensis]|uniref:GNAT family N-acetyltransferase n=1 Tax=Rubneribacter badeniensis TaxID=2070688 RepID=UPI003A947CC3
MRIEMPAERSGELVAALVDVWERSVRATHDFLVESDIALLRREVGPGVEGVAALAVAYGADGAPCGFAGMQDGRLEMLFVAPEARGRGVGSALLSLAVERFGVEALDVNEQNPQAVGFYEHEGFVVAGRSPVDDAGRPWPILRMRLERERR